MKRKNYGPISNVVNPAAIQELSDCMAFDHQYGIDYYNPANLPSCIVHVGVGVASGLEQRGSDGFLDFKLWDCPMPNGQFVCLPLSDAEKRHRIQSYIEEMY